MHTHPAFLCPPNPPLPYGFIHCGGQKRFTTKTLQRITSTGSLICTLIVHVPVFYLSTSQPLLHDPYSMYKPCMCALTHWQVSIRKLYNIWYNWQKSHILCIHVNVVGFYSQHIYTLQDVKSIQYLQPIYHDNASLSVLLYKHIWFCSKYLYILWYNTTHVRMSTRVSHSTYNAWTKW